MQYLGTHLTKPWLSSSPRAIDLNKDGVLDIVLGTGQLESQQTDTIIGWGVDMVILRMVTTKRQMIFQYAAYLLSHFISSFL